jgi:hypothetical protein
MRHAQEPGKQTIIIIIKIFKLAFRIQKVVGRVRMADCLTGYATRSGTWQKTNNKYYGL